METAGHCDKSVAPSGLRVGLWAAPPRQNLALRFCSRDRRQTRSKLCLRFPGFFRQLFDERSVWRRHTAERAADGRRHTGNGIGVTAEIGTKNRGLPGVSLRQPNNCKRGRYSLAAVASDLLTKLLMIALAKSRVINGCMRKVLCRDDQRQHFSAAPGLDVAGGCLQDRLDGRSDNQSFRNSSGDGCGAVLTKCDVRDVDQACNLHRLRGRGTWISGVYTFHRCDRHCRARSRHGSLRDRARQVAKAKLRCGMKNRRKETTDLAAK